MQKYMDNLRDLKDVYIDSSSNQKQKMTWKIYIVFYSIIFYFSPIKFSSSFDSVFK